MLRHLKILATALCILASSHAFAGPNTTYSREINVSNEEIMKGVDKRYIERGTKAINEPSAELEGKWMIALVSYVVQHRPTWKISRASGKWTALERIVSVPGGGGFKVAVDPGGVEIQLDPETNAEMESRMEYHRFLYEAFTAVGLEVVNRPMNDEVELVKELKKRGITNPTQIEVYKRFYRNEMPAHLNIGARSAWGDDVESFIRYITYWLNQEKPYEIFANNTSMRMRNATPLNRQPIEQQREFQGLLSSFEEKTTTTVDAAADWMNDKVYTNNPYVKEDGTPRDHHHKQQIGLKYLSTPAFETIDQPFEHRDLRQPISADEDLATRKLFDKFIDFAISEKGAPLHYVARADIKRGRIITVSVREDAFELLLLMSQAKANWKDYQIVFAPVLRDYMGAHETELINIFNGNFDWKNNSLLLEHFENITGKWTVPPKLES